VAVLEADAADPRGPLTGIQEDIEAIASRPVAGPVFRLLIKGKLRRHIESAIVRGMDAVEVEALEGLQEMGSDIAEKLSG
jgi:hypothetical protein